MGFFDWLFGKRIDEAENKKPERSEEHAVLVYIQLSDEDFGTEEEREKIFALEEKLIAAIEEAQVGEYDGNEFGGGHAVLHMYGQDADALFEAVVEHFEDHDFMSDSYVIKRFGPADQFDVREEKIDLAKDQ